MEIGQKEESKHCSIYCTSTLLNEYNLIGLNTVNVSFAMDNMPCVTVTHL